MTHQTAQVYRAIASVMHQISKQGIAKDQKNSQQGYRFRGIDDVLNALSPILAEHKLCILPRVVSRDMEERQTKNGGTLFYTTVTVEYDFVSAEDGSKHTVCIVGEAMDSADKSTNKAMSAAYKYAAFQAFCIPTEGDNDADATTHEVLPIYSKSVPKDTFDRLDEQSQNDLRTIAMDVISYLSKGDSVSAFDYIESMQLDADNKTALWSLFDSKQRAELKKISSMKKAA